MGRGIVEGSVASNLMQSESTPIESLDDDRRGRLLGIKLTALASSHLKRDIQADPFLFPRGAALMVDQSAWVLVEEAAGRSLGGALSWALRNGATSLNVVTESDEALLARRSERFSYPIAVWAHHDRNLNRVGSTHLQNAPAPLTEHLQLRSVIESAGAVVNVEHGVVFGEVRGLEVCRVVDRPTVGLFAELGDVAPGGSATLLDAENPATLRHREFEGVQLEVGVGANDREAFQLLHGDVPTVEALRGVVEAVETHRSLGARQHPLNRLGAERFLRWRLEQEPTLIDMFEVRPAEPPVARPNLKDPVPCVARATIDGRSTMVVCSTGVDLDLIPFVADVQAMYGDPVMVVAPERDLVSITREMAELLTASVDLRPVN